MAPLRSCSASTGPMSLRASSLDTTSLSCSIFRPCHREVRPRSPSNCALRFIMSKLRAVSSYATHSLTAEDLTKLISSVSLLKRNALAAPFERAFADQKTLEGMPAPTDGSPEPQGDLMEIHYRDEEAIYVRASPDRVTVVFSTIFKDETDRIFGKVFLQEFVDARRQAALQNAPQVLYSNREPPLEIRHLRGLKSSEDVGYVTFGERP